MGIRHVGFLGKVGLMVNADSGATNVHTGFTQRVAGLKCKGMGTYVCMYCKKGRKTGILLKREKQSPDQRVTDQSIALFLVKLKPFLVDFPATSQSWHHSRDTPADQLGAGSLRLSGVGPKRALQSTTTSHNHSQPNA